jgi:hypothetical protein
MKKKNYRSIFEHIKDQPKKTIDKIYGSNDDKKINCPWACKAVFQSLSMLSKSIVMRLIFVRDLFQISELLEWANSESVNVYLESVNELLSLRIIESLHQNGNVENILINISVDTGSVQKYFMNEYFRENFKFSLVCSYQPWYDGNEVEKVESTQLEKFTDDRWNEILGLFIITNFIS